MYSTHGESKSMVVERFIRTLKDITTKYFTEHSTRDWVNNITKFLQIYNNRKHSKTKLSPVEASKPRNEGKVGEQCQQEEYEYEPPKFLIGDKVRISRGTFEKGYENNWSYEVFTVTDILPTPPHTYKIKDYLMNQLKGLFMNKNY